MTADARRGAPCGRAVALVRPLLIGRQTAGSFVRYLLDAHGMAPLKRLFSGSWRDASAAAVNQRMAGAYDMDLAAAEAQWHAFLRTHQ